MRWLALLAALAALAVASTTAGPAHADAGIVNQASTTDPAGDSGTGPDLSGLTVTTYTDGTISFAVQFSNRNYLQSGETVQIFVDVDGDGKADLNLSVWPSFEPSYLDRSTGSDWTDIRQLPELVQTPGAISERLSLNELQSAAALPVASTIRVRVASATADSTGTEVPNDWLPGPTQALPFPLKPTASTGTTTTTTATTGSSTTTAASRPTAAKIPVAVKVDSPGLVHAGQDAKLRIVLRSAKGPMRLFKVCTDAAGVPHPTQCRSAEATGQAPVAFTISYRLAKPGPATISIDASAGSATASATAVVRVAKS